jgi:hypothetical protein
VGCQSVSVCDSTHCYVVQLAYCWLLAPDLLHEKHVRLDVHHQQAGSGCAYLSSYVLQATTNCLHNCSNGCTSALT